MKKIFADTSFYIAIVNPDDAWHNAALASGNTYSGTVYTTEYIILELGNYLSKTIHRSFLLEIVTELRNDPKTIIIPSSPSLFEDGLRLYAHRLDKQWSLTDCISFSLMEKLGMTEALAFDHHFEQAGFHVLTTPRIS
jgi:uncharacterized protein